MPTEKNNAEKFSVWTLFTLAILFLLGVGISKEAEKGNPSFSWMTTSETRTAPTVALPPGEVALELECGEEAAATVLPNYKLRKAVFVVPPCGDAPSSPVEILNPSLYWQMQDQDARHLSKNTYIVEAMWDGKRAQNGIEPHKWIPWASGGQEDEDSVHSPNLPNRFRFKTPSKEKITVEVNFF